MSRMTRAPGGGLLSDIGESLGPVITLALDLEEPCQVANVGHNPDRVSPGGLLDTGSWPPTASCLGECLSFGHGASGERGASLHLLQYKNRFAPNVRKRGFSEGAARYLRAETQGLTQVLEEGT